MNRRTTRRITEDKPPQPFPPDQKTEERKTAAPKTQPSAPKTQPKRSGTKKK